MATACEGRTPRIDPDAMVASFRQRAVALLEGIASNVSPSCEPDPPAGRFFVAEVTAETAAGQVRISYGDREFEIRSFVHPSAQPSSLDLVFYLDALGYDSEDVVDSMWVNSLGRLERVLEAHAEGLRVCLKALASDAAGLWRAAEDRRIKATAAFQDQLRRDGLRRASARAAHAFREGRFAEVVELLGPYENILTEAQGLKLKLASERSASSR